MSWLSALLEGCGVLQGFSFIERNIELRSQFPASRTAFKIFSTEGLKRNKTFLATVLPFTWTVSSPRFPLTISTSTPGSLRKASATRAACC